mmetsp:Transcript_82667/g.267628  ORF Transcript_82667/g.267628 Transcript_82667/m.267628 type:complete len:364 (-) Transcript_82667:146-1237(-)
MGFDPQAVLAGLPRGAVGDTTSDASFELVSERHPNSPSVARLSGTFDEDSWVQPASNVSQRSILSDASWVSAPARLNLPRCFAPSTAFRLAFPGSADARLGVSGQNFVRAAELRSGVLLEGPQGPARVHKVIKLPPLERDFVRLHFLRDSSAVQGASASSSPKCDTFCITADHKVFIRQPDGSLTPVSAQELISLVGNGRGPCIRSAFGFQEVMTANRETNRMPVVEVWFYDPNAAVFAWEFPSRTPRTVRESAAVACGGQFHSTSYSFEAMGNAVASTFWGSMTQPRALRRSSSLGATPSPVSTWTIGTIGHDDAELGKCKVCAVHHRYLMPISNTRCKYGARCKLCHHPHPELDRRLQLLT